MVKKQGEKLDLKIKGCVNTERKFYTKATYMQEQLGECMSSQTELTCKCQDFT